MDNDLDALGIETIQKIKKSRQSQTNQKNKSSSQSILARENKGKQAKKLNL